MVKKKTCWYSSPNAQSLPGFFVPHQREILGCQRWEPKEPLGHQGHDFLQPEENDVSYHNFSSLSVMGGVEDNVEPKRRERLAS